MPRSNDAARPGYTEQLGDERGDTAAALLLRAIEFFLEHGITPERLLTANGSPFRSHA